jgi:hypothetical protein
VSIKDGLAKVHKEVAQWPDWMKGGDKMVADINITFCRSLLSQIHADVKLHFPDVNLRSAWVYKAFRQHWEFHGPDGFYWHGGADNAYEARYKGWEAWLRHKLPGYGA